MKTLLKLLTGLVVLLVIAAGVFLYTFDANRYKQEITDLAESVTGRSISIAGDLNISVYPWIGIKVNEVTVGNVSGFSSQTFATLGQLDVDINILPLLRKRLEIDRLVLHRLVVDFEKNAAGENNWSDLAGTDDSDQVKSKFGLAGLSIGDIDLKDARLSWLDVNTGKQFKISKMSLGTKVINEGQPLPVELKALVESNQPEWKVGINAKTEVVFDSDSAAFDARGLKLSAKALLPDSELGKLSVAMVADTRVDLQNQTAQLLNTRLGLLGLVIAGSFDVENIFSVPVIQGPIKVKTFKAETLAEHLKFDLPQLASSQSLQKISLSGSFRTDFDGVQLDEISGIVDQSKVRGFVHLDGLTQPVVRYELKADQVDLNDYQLVSADTGGNAAPLPLDFIRMARLEGELDIETALFDGVELKLLHIASNIDGGVLNANPVTMLVNAGEVNAAMRLDARDTPAVMLTAEVKQVDAAGSINPLLVRIIGDDAPVLSGRVNADININAKGFTMPALKKSAQGTIELYMGEGAIQGVDFNYVTQAVVVDYAARNAFRVSRTFNEEYVPDSITAFDSLNATFKLSKGRLVNKDLLLVSDQVNVTGSGYIDFVKGRVDYQPEIDMNVKKTGNIRDKLRDHPMMYHARGELGGLSYEFDQERYDLHMGRLMIQEAKANRNRQINSQSEDNWQNAISTK